MPSQTTTTPTTIKFQAALEAINDWNIFRLPPEASAQLKTRNIAYVTGTINGHVFETDLEPDGTGKHWFAITKNLQAITGLKVGDTATLVIEPTKTWPEPEVPADVAKALKDDSKAHDTWLRATPMARWEWIRWIRATGRDETRKKHIEVACSKLRSGMRRPCCFNSSMCTVPEVSKSGVLLGSGPARYS